MTFLERTKSLFYPDFKRLTLRNLTGDLTESESKVNSFLNDKTLSKNIDIFQLASRHHVAICGLEPSLRICYPKITKQVKLYYLSLTMADLKVVFGCCTSAEEI